MSRPRNTLELVDAEAASHAKLLAMIASLTPEQREAEFAFEDRDRNVRDVLVHLHEWHELLLRWVEANTEGEPASFLPEGYTWASFAGLNMEFRDKHAATSVDDAEALYVSSRARVRDIFELFTDEELFTKQHFSWTGTTSLGAYCISATSSHDEWAMKKIRKHLRG